MLRRAGARGHTTQVRGWVGKVGILEGNKSLLEIPSVPIYNCVQIRLCFQSFNKGNLSATNLILSSCGMQPTAKGSNDGRRCGQGGPRAGVRRTPLDPGWQNESNLHQRQARLNTRLMRAIDALGHLPRRGDRKGRVGQMRNWPVSGSGPAQDHCLRPWQPTPWHAMPTPWHATQQNEWIAERSAARAKKTGHCRDTVRMDSV